MRRALTGWHWLPQQTVIAMSAAVALVLSALVGLDLQREYQSEVAAAGAKTHNLTQVLTEHARQSLRRVDISLAQAAAVLQEQAALPKNDPKNDPDVVRDRMRALLPKDGLIRALVQVNANGAIVMSTVNEDVHRIAAVADRDYFTVHRDVSSQGVFVGHAVKSRTSGAWIIPASIRLGAPEDPFRGVLMAVIEPAYFQSFYDSIDTGANGFVTLFTRQGWIAARAPFDETMIARNWSMAPMFSEHLVDAQAKTVWQVVAADGVERIYSYQAMKEYPVVVAMGSSLSDSLAPWRTHAARMVVLLLLMLGGVLAGTLVAVRQLKERQRVEQTLRTIIETEPECVKLLDGQGNLVEMNAAGLAMLEADSLAQLQTHGLINCVQSDYRDAFFTLHHDVMRGESAQLKFQTVGLRGGLRWMETHAAPIRDPNGAVTHLLGVTRDITAEHQAMLALQLALKEKTSLLNEVHHRVKNNLQVISSLLRLEAGRSAADNTKSVLTDMQARIRTMALLHESLYRSGVFARVNLGDYLRQLATQGFRSMVDSKMRVQLELELADVFVSLDQATPCGLLVNELISNCCKHAFPDDRSGKVRVALQWLPVDDGAKPLACLSVSDTGAGLPPDFEARCGQSLGMQLVVDLSGQIGGTLGTDHLGGTRFYVTFTPDVPQKFVAPKLAMSPALDLETA